jgi:hypothetical protein
MPPKKDIYTVFCVVAGEFDPFPIKIHKSEPVGVLKDKIWEARKNTFAKIDAAQLILYHVEISVDDDVVKAECQAEID